MKGKHLTLHDRQILERMLLQGQHKQTIADALGRSLRTIYNEIARGTYEHTDAETWLTVPRYSAELAHQKYRANMATKGPRPILLSKPGIREELRRYIVGKDYSPRAALYAMKAAGSETVAPGTVYAAIRRGLIDGVQMRDLPRRGVRPKRKKQTVAKTASRGTSIEYRPIDVLMRKSFGHWEMDLVVGPTGSHRALLVLTERLTRYEIIEPLKNHSAAEVVRALNRIEREMGKQFYTTFLSITVDNGREFNDYEGMEKALYRKGRRTKIYYCHGYSPHERGSNENQNRFIRRRHPKGTDLKLTRREAAYLAAWMNDYPRRIFAGETAGQRFARELDATGFT